MNRAIKSPRSGVAECSVFIFSCSDTTPLRSLVNYRMELTCHVATAGADVCVLRMHLLPNAKCTHDEAARDCQGLLLDHIRIHCTLRSTVYATMAILAYPSMARSTLKLLESMLVNPVAGKAKLT